MDINNSFSPQVSKPQKDRTVSVLLSLAQWLLIGTVGILPLLFIPGVLNALGQVKMFVVIVMVSVSFLLYAFAFLRSGTLSFSPHAAWVAFWVVALATIVSALLSKDLSDSLFGDAFATNTALGVTILVLVATLAINLGKHTRRAVQLFLVLCASAFLLGLWHLSRLIFGAEFLSFGLFTGSTQSLLGPWNDVALFYGLVIILLLVAAEQLTLSRVAKTVSIAMVVLSLVLLFIINFSVLWFILGFLGLAFLLYTMTKHRFTEVRIPGIEDTNILFPGLLAALVFVAAVVAIIGGSALSTAISNATNISYMEVRPSFTASLDIMQSTLHTHAFSGIGANRFMDAWRQYKDVTLNETVFWNTDFASGYSYVLTVMTETGLLGIVAWAAFLLLFVWLGIRVLVRGGTMNRVQRFVAIASFTAALYVWGMSLLYVPGVAMLLLGAVMTGVFFGVIPGRHTYQLSFEQNQRLAFLFVGVVMAVIIAGVALVYVTSRQFVSMNRFDHAVYSLQLGVSLDDAENGIVSASQFAQNDMYMREIAWYELARITQLMQIEQPTEADQQTFNTAAAKGVDAAQRAAALDQTDPANWQVLGQLYATVAPKDLADKAYAAYDMAASFNPQSPLYDLLRAQLATQTGDNATARTHITAALQKKHNYTDALLLLTQLDIADGQVDDAITTTQAIISIEPTNPSRYYQLGILLRATKRFDDAVAAFEYALTLDQTLANARYFLGLTYADAGEKELALTELKKVQETNQDNTDLQATIDSINNGTYQTASPTATNVVDEEPTVSTTDEVVTATDGADTTPLVSPVNTTPEQAVDGQ